MGRMLAMRQPPAPFTSVMFMRKVVSAGGWPGAPRVKRIGTWSWAAPSESSVTRSPLASGASFQVPW